MDARYKASRPKRDTMGTKGYSYDYLEEQDMIARDFEAQWREEVEQAEAVEARMLCRKELGKVRYPT